MSVASASHTSKRTKHLSPNERGLNTIQDLCVFVAILVIPLTSATHLELGSAIFVAASLLLGSCWAVQQLFFNRGLSRASGAELIIGAGIALIVLQLTPLPSGLLQILSPFHAEYLPAWQGDFEGSSALPRWSTISLTPALTRSGLVLFIGYAIFFVTLHQRLKSADDIKGVVRLVATACVLMALIGLTQSMLQMREFLGAFAHPSRSAAWPVKGTFTNQNHFAHFLALGVGPLMWCWLQFQNHQQSEWQRARHNHRSASERARDQMIMTAVSVSVGLVAIAGLLSTSRGGIVALTFTISFVAMFLVKDRRRLLTYAIPIAVVVVAGVLVSDVSMLTQKFNDLIQADSLSDVSQGLSLIHI